MDEKVMKAMDEYCDRFDKRFPSISLLRHNGDEATIAIIERCLKENKDVYELGILLNLDTDICY